MEQRKNHFLFHWPFEAEENMHIFLFIVQEIDVLSYRSFHQFSSLTMLLAQGHGGRMEPIPAVWGEGRVTQWHPGRSPVNRRVQARRHGWAMPAHGISCAHPGRKAQFSDRFIWVLFFQSIHLQLIPSILTCQSIQPVQSMEGVLASYL